MKLLSIIVARNYKGLDVWQLGYELTLKLYKLTETFPESEQNNLTSQIRRASTSIPLNIAEGSSRFTKKSDLQFLQYAYGSIKEIQVLLDLSKDLGYIQKNSYDEVNEDVDKLSRKLFVFIKTVERENFFNWFR